MSHVVTIFSSRTRFIGDSMTLTNNDGETIVGTIVGTSADDPKYQKFEVGDARSATGKRTINTGNRYYQVEIED